MKSFKETKWSTGFFGWENCKWFIRQIQATFSNQPSFFARKRIESFMLFMNATILLDMFCWKNWDKIDSTEMLAIFGAQMVYAGYQVAQIRKDMVGPNKVESLPKQTNAEADIENKEVKEG